MRPVPALCLGAAFAILALPAFRPARAGDDAGGGARPSPVQAFRDHGVAVVMGQSVRLVARVAPGKGETPVWKVNGVAVRDAPGATPQGLATFSPNSVSAHCGGAEGRLALVLGTGAWGSPSADRQAEAYRVEPTSYGTYTARIKAAAPTDAPDGRSDSESVVSAFYTYGHARSGRHSEIDFEIYSNDAREVDLSVWNRYQDRPARQRMITRRVNVVNGDWREKKLGPKDPVGGEFGEVRHGGPRIESFDAARTYHDYRFVWAKDRVVFSIKDGSWKTLWECRAGQHSCAGGPAHCTPNCPVPRMEAQAALNLWAVPYDHCGSTRSAPCAPTTSSYQMLVDEVAYLSSDGAGSFSDGFSAGALDPSAWGRTTGCNELGPCLIEAVAIPGGSSGDPVSWTLSYEAGPCAQTGEEGY